MVNSSAGTVAISVALAIGIKIRFAPASNATCRQPRRIVRRETGARGAGLSELSVWAGRYPVARHQSEYVGKPNSDELLDYGSRNPIMRMFFDRARNALEAKFAKPLENRFGAVVVFRQPGT